MGYQNFIPYYVNSGIIFMNLTFITVVVGSFFALLIPTYFLNVEIMNFVHDYFNLKYLLPSSTDTTGLDVSLSTCIKYHIDDTICTKEELVQI